MPLEQRFPGSNCDEMEADKTEKAGEGKVTHAEAASSESVNHAHLHRSGLYQGNSRSTV